MKQFLVTILAFLYLATSSGATVTLHYCMGKSIDAKAKCSKCGMEKKGGCCEDKVKVVKTQDIHALQTADFSCPPLFAVLHSGYPAITPVSPVSAMAPAAQSNSPPGSSGISLCILHCVFRI